MKNSQRITPKIPDGMVELMKNLAKSVLKEQPDNIYLFAAEYFENLVRERDGSLDRGYSTFRKYDDEKRRGVEVCPRCNCILHPERKDDEALEGGGDVEAEDSSPRNDDEKVLDMSVNGVAIKAMPRDGKSSKGQKNRQRLETIRSESMDSAIEDDGKSQSISPKPNSQDKTVDHGLNLHGLSAIASNIPDQNNEHNVDDSTEKLEIESNEMDSENSAVAESPTNESNIETLSSIKLPADEDVPDTPTNDTSVSETITDRTVIEVAPLNSDAKNDELNTSDSTQADDLDANVKPNTAETIQTIVTEPIEEQQPNDDSESVQTTEPANLQSDQSKQMDRLRTPESDSGLSEKSFNLNIQENEESIVNDVNEMKDETDKLSDLKLTQFDTASKNDSGIVDIDENLLNVAQNGKDEEEIESAKSGNDEKTANIAAAEQQPAIDNANAPANIQENNSQETSDNISKEEQQEKEKRELSETIQIDDLTNPNETAAQSTTETPIASNETDAINESNELSSEKMKETDSTESDLKSSPITDDNNNEHKIETDTVTETIEPESDTDKLTEPINGQQELQTEQSAHEDVAQTPEYTAQDEQVPNETISSKNDEPSLHQTNENQNIDSNDNVSNAIELDENKEQKSEQSKSLDADENDKIPSNVQGNEVESSDEKAVDVVAKEEPTEISNEDNISGEKRDDVEMAAAEGEKSNAGSTEQRPATTDTSGTLDGESNENPNDMSSKENKVNEIENDKEQSESIASLEREAPKSADFSEKTDEKLNEMPHEATPSQEENYSENRDELNSSENNTQLEEEIAAESSTEKPLEEQNNIRNKREIDGSIDEGTAQVETVDEHPNAEIINDESASAEIKQQTDSLSLKEEDLKSENDANQSDDVKLNGNVGEVEEDDKTEDTINAKIPENVEKTDATPSVTQEENSSSVEPEVVRVDAKQLENASNSNSDQNELSLDDGSNRMESNDVNNEINAEPNHTEETTDHTTWEEATDKIAEKVAEHDANLRKVSISSLTGDKDQVNDDKDVSQTEAEPSENNANDNSSMIADDKDASDNVASPEQSGGDTDQMSMGSEPNDIKSQILAQSESDEGKSADHNSTSDEQKIFDSKSIHENDNVHPESDKLSVDGSNKIETVSSENDSKTVNETEQSENCMEIDTKSVDQQETEVLSSETKAIEPQNSKNVDNDIETSASPSSNNNDDKSIAAVESQPKNPIDIEQSETKLDIDVTDGASDDIYSTPPETGNQENAHFDAPNDDVDSKFETNDESKQENQIQSNELQQNNSDGSNELKDSLKSDENNGSVVIETNKPDSSKPEESNLVDEVKENQTILPTENTANHSEGVNEIMEKSPMPTEGPSVSATHDDKSEENQNVNTSASDEVETALTNEKVSSARSECIERKSLNGTEAGSECDAKSANEDVASELSVSLKDEYEQAETEIVGDESVKDLDLSSNPELDANQANESAESEQQLTALEVPPANDNDSIDSPKPTQMQPDSLDILVDSLDASLEPSVDADSLNIDSLEDKPRSAKSTDTGKLKDSEESIVEEVSSPVDTQPEMNDKTNKDSDVQPSVRHEPERTTRNDTNSHLTLLAVPKVKRSTGNVMGDMVDNKSNADIMHDQMRNELEVLRLAEHSVPIQLLGIAEIDSPLTPKKEEMAIFVSTPDDQMKAVDDSMQLKKDGENPQSRLDEPKTNEIVIANEDHNVKDDHETDETDTSDGVKKIVRQSDESFDEKHDENLSEQPKAIAEFSEQNTSFSESVSESNTTAATEDQTEQSSEFYSTTIETSETQTSEDVIEVVEVVEIIETIKCVEYLKPMGHDTQSSDLSDTDTTDKAEKVYTESGVDETSRDERDEVSEIENFDLSSCGEDSLEAMYYMIRKNEIIMDRNKQTSAKNCDDDKIIFPEKATDDLEHAVREVSGGKKVKLCSMSMNSSMDDVVLKKMSTDSDEIQIHVIPNSDIDSSSSCGGGGVGAGGDDEDGANGVPKPCSLKEQCTANESTDDEYINPIVDSMRKNEAAVDEMHAKALSVQPKRSETQSDEQLETDTFNEMDDMMPGNIERKILASSVSEADSDYFELPPTANRLTKDDFNVSTAFEHMIRADNSTTDESDSTMESASTKIQALTALTRRRIRKSSAGTSASNEKCSSIGNAAIDKSLDNLIEQQELMEEHVYSESFEDSSPQSQTVDSVDSEKPLGITEVKVEQRKNEEASAKVTVDSKHSDEKVPEINIEGVSEKSDESVTAQRRLTLQRGDAMQRNSTPESSEQQQVDKDLAKNKESNNQDAKNMHDNDPKSDTPSTNVSKSINKPLRGLGPRQRSMPVQIDSQVIRVLPKQVSKRVKSANSSSSKNHRPYLF